MGHIRGIYASASLKLCRFVPYRSSYRYIRGIYASASLKQPRYIDQLDMRFGYPRHLRLGLIEARNTWARLVPPPHIRGIYASASLKLVNPINIDCHVDYIRGIYASASLKPPLYSAPGCMSFPYIRGIYASASLKLAPLWFSAPLSEGYPRHLRLGLIEAQDWPSIERITVSISEAFTPRPH